MSFITQGKTNIKYLLIVVVLAVIVGGGILWCASKQETGIPQIKPPEGGTANWETFTESTQLGNKCSIKYPNDWEVKHEESTSFSYLTPKEQRIPEDIWVTIDCFPVDEGYINQNTGEDLLPSCKPGEFSLTYTEGFEAIKSKEFCTLSDDGSQIGTVLFQVRYGRQR
ncbi:hypothetical protein ACFL06_02035, partial [Patescibacteria group bacterium]